jgi:hypothetical protein
MLGRLNQRTRIAASASGVQALTSRMKASVASSAGRAARRPKAAVAPVVLRMSQVAPSSA